MQQLLVLIAKSFADIVKVFVTLVPEDPEKDCRAGQKDGRDQVNCSVDAPERLLCLLLAAGYVSKARHDQDAKGGSDRISEFCRETVGRVIAAVLADSGLLLPEIDAVSDHCKADREAAVENAVYPVSDHDLCHVRERCKIYNEQTD